MHRHSVLALVTGSAVEGTYKMGFELWLRADDCGRHRGARRPDCAHVPLLLRPTSVEVLFDDSARLQQTTMNALARAPADASAIDAVAAALLGLLVSATTNTAHSCACEARESLTTAVESPNGTYATLRL